MRTKEHYLGTSFRFWSGPSSPKDDSPRHHFEAELETCQEPGHDGGLWVSIGGWTSGISMVLVNLSSDHYFFMGSLVTSGQGRVDKNFPKGTLWTQMLSCQTLSS